MSLFKQITQESRGTLALSLPLIAGHLSHMLMGLADTVMIGQLGAAPLAASALSNSLLHLPLVFGIGLATAVSIQVSQARGAGITLQARASLRHGLYLAVAVGLLSIIGTCLILPTLPWLRQAPEVIAAMPGYFVIAGISILPACMSMMVKGHADAMNRPWPPFWILLGSVLFNIFLNWLLIYGHWGFPAWGLEGAGVATLLARTASFAALLYWHKRDRHLSDWVPVHWFRKPDWAALKALWRLGLPTSLQIVAELSAMIGATLIIGSLGAAALAAHQVAITCAATVYMVPMGISQALTVRIGESWGANTRERMRPILIGGWLMAALFTLFSASGFYVFHEPISRWFLPDSAAAQVAAKLLLIAAVFQFSDAMQIVSVGALRGLSDVRFPAWFSFFACWFISLPLGAVLAFHYGEGVAGMWWGFCLSLSLMAFAFGVRAWRKTRGQEFLSIPCLTRTSHEGEL